MKPGKQGEGALCHSSEGVIRQKRGGAQVTSAGYCLTKCGPLDTPLHKEDAFFLWLITSISHAAGISMTWVRQSSNHKHVSYANVRRESTRTGTYHDEKHGCAEDIEYDDSQRDILWQENQMQQKQRDGAAISSAKRLNSLLPQVPSSPPRRAKLRLLA